MFVAAPERLGVGRLARKEGFQVCCRLIAKRQDIFSSSLAVSGHDGHRVVLEVERRDLQAPQFLSSQSGLDREAVEQGPLGPIHAVSLRPVQRCHQQASHLIDLKGYSVVPAVYADVLGLQVSNRRLGGAPVLHHPPRELLEGLEIEIARLHRKATAP
ncbi:MAG TPA: hypothetical protein P5242_18230 [Sedimentisphaerales bacterium]|nr:hypothetical protein [Sedimentisphaerales bacterium]